MQCAFYSHESSERLEMYKNALEYLYGALDQVLVLAKEETLQFNW